MKKNDFQIKSFSFHLQNVFPVHLRNMKLLSSGACLHYVSMEDGGWLFCPIYEIFYMSVSHAVKQKH